MLSRAVLLAALISFVFAPFGAAPSVPTVCGDYGCDITVITPGRLDAVAGGPLDQEGDEPEPPDPCPWTRVNDLGANSSWWEGNDPSAGYIEINSCAGGNPNAPGGTVVLTRFVPNGVAAPPPPDPAVLAQQAIGQLTVPKPTVGVGPDRATMAVNLWTWLWVDNLPPVTVTVAAGGVSVTATATLTSTTWSLGEPAATGGPYEAGPPVTVTCAGAGTPPPPGYDWKSEPPCGHMYQWRSTKERTGGAGTWPVTATTTWAVAWASNTGVTGADTLTATTADQFDVSEYRVVLVNSPGG
jgi:hypothetical protein